MYLVHYNCTDSRTSSNPLQILPGRNSCHCRSRSASEIILISITVYYSLQTKFAKVVFLQVPVCPRGGGCLPHTHILGRHLPLGRHLLGRHPQADTPRHPLADTPLPSACWDTVKKRAVRILLECIIVIIE